MRTGDVKPFRRREVDSSTDSTTSVLTEVPPPGSQNPRLPKAIGGNKPIVSGVYTGVVGSRHE